MLPVPYSSVHTAPPPDRSKEVKSPRLYHRIRSARALVSFKLPTYSTTSPSQTLSPRKANKLNHSRKFPPCGSFRGAAAEDMYVCIHSVSPVDTRLGNHGRRRSKQNPITHPTTTQPPQEASEVEIHHEKLFAQKKNISPKTMHKIICRYTTPPPPATPQNSR
jgi:hypothetical protein